MQVQKPAKLVVQFIEFGCNEFQQEIKTTLTAKYAENE
jgi:hypothetical protein